MTPETARRRAARGRRRARRRGDGAARRRAAPPGARRGGARARRSSATPGATWRGGCESIYERIAGRRDGARGRMMDFAVAAQPLVARRCWSSRRSRSRSLLLWWRGPDWDRVYHAFDFVDWRWIVAALRAEPRAPCCSAPLSWRATIDQALGPSAPALRQRLLGVRRSACSGTRSLPGRIGELARVAVLRASPPARTGDERDARRHRLRPPALRRRPRPAPRRLRARRPRRSRTGR